MFIKVNNNQNNRKNILMYIMFIVIIAILLVGIIYQFVCIKSLQAQLDNGTSANILAYIKNAHINI